MTREKAIAELSVILERLSHPEDCEMGCYSFRDGDYCEALDIAIDALMHEIRTETHGVCSDLISRADAIEAVAQQWLFEASAESPYVNDDDIGEYRKLAEELFEDVPSADAVEHDGCKNCRYEQNTEYEYPCKDCKQNYKDKWEQKPRNTANWIPCSERLPKEKQEVYVTVYFIEGDAGRAYGYMDGFGKWHLYSTVEGTLNSGYEVTAWMPLPEPFEGGDDE